MSRDESISPPLRVPMWLAEAALFVVVMAPTAAPFLHSNMRPGSVFTWIVSVATVLILPLRRKWPIPVLALLLVFFAATSFSEVHLPGVAFAIAIVVYYVSSTTNRRRSFVVAICSFVTMACISAAVTFIHGDDPTGSQFVIVIAGVAAAGDASRSRREYLAATMERAERAEQTRESEARRRVTEERLRIARDLHDAVAHQISVISLNAGVASSSLDADPERTREALRTIRSSSRTVLGEIGDLMTMLRSSDDDEPHTSPQYGLSQLDVLLDRFAKDGLNVTRRVEGDVTRVGGAADLVAYRVIQEALTNARKHGATQRATAGHEPYGTAHVLLAIMADTLEITVTNPMRVDSIRLDHSGQDAEDRGASATGYGMGLLGIRERVSSVRGTVIYGPTAGSWKLFASIPLPHEGRT